MLPRRIRSHRIVVFYATSCLTILSAAFLLTLVSIKYGERNEDPALSPFFKKMIPGGTSVCESETIFQCDSCFKWQGNLSLEASEGRAAGVDNHWEFQFGRDDRNVAMDEAQCNAAFPGLYEDIIRAEKFRDGSPIVSTDISSIQISNGMVHAMIVDKQLYVLAANFRDSVHRQRGVAILHAIYRSISAMPFDSYVPNIEWVFTVEDYSPDLNHPIWALARRANDHNVWLMPDFGFWSWDIENLGPFDSVVSQIIDQEDNCWNCKIKKAIWRGSIWTAPKLRRSLIDAAKGKGWSDIEPLRDATAEDPGNHLHAVAQCDYMFSIHAEGRSYSGSLKYRQACRSVVLIHKLQWIQHHHYLLISNGTNQNYVSVERDFSDLESAIQSLLADPEEAKRIADNNVKTFRERYLTPAAEACYWRALIRAWSEVAFTPFPYVDLPPDLENGRTKASRRVRGMRFENYIISETDVQMDFKFES